MNGMGGCIKVHEIFEHLSTSIFYSDLDYCIIVKLFFMIQEYEQEIYGYYSDE